MIRVDQHWTSSGKIVGLPENFCKKKAKIVIDGLTYCVGNYPGRHLKMICKECLFLRRDAKDEEEEDDSRDFERAAKKIIPLIPTYPDKIRMCDIVKKTGISSCAVLSAMMYITVRYPLAEEKVGGVTYYFFIDYDKL